MASQDALLTRKLPDDYFEVARAKPSLWCHRFLGTKFSPLQEQIMEAVRDHPRIAIRSCHASAKTHTMGSAALWYLSAYPGSLVLATGPTFRQVQENTWKELTKAYQSAPVPLGGHYRKDCRLQIGPGWGVIGFATDNPINWSGFHAERILLIVDEASGIDEGQMEAMEGLRSAGSVTQVLLSQPTRTSGTFYNAFHGRRDGWCCISISAFQTPNFQPEVLSQWLGREVVFGDGWSPIQMAQHLQGLWHAAGKPQGFTWPVPYLVNPAWACQLAEDYGGVESDSYLVRVLGEFPTGDPHAVISLHDFESACRRAGETTDAAVMGVDVARFGNDDSVIMVRRGPTVVKVEVHHGQDTHEIAGLCSKLAAEMGVVDINVDVIGVGSGVADSLRRMTRARVHDVNVGAKPGRTEDQERFENARAQHYWGLRERFESNEINLGMIDPKLLDRLSPELIGVRYEHTAAGKIKIESKDDFKKRLNRSPDMGDALMLTFASVTDSLLVLSGADIFSDDPFDQFFQ